MSQGPDLAMSRPCSRKSVLRAKAEYISYMCSSAWTHTISEHFAGSVEQQTQSHQVGVACSTQ